MRDIYLKKERKKYIPYTMSCRENPFITDDSSSANMVWTLLEAQLIRMLAYINYRTSHDPRVKKESRSQKGCCNIKFDDRICLVAISAKKLAPKCDEYINHARIQSFLYYVQRFIAFWTFSPKMKRRKDNRKYG